MDESFNGFIRENVDLKILILYILRRLPAEAELGELSDLMRCDGAIHFFDFHQCLTELVEMEQVTEDEGSYRITDLGAKNADTLEYRLPYSVKAKADKLIKPVAERLFRLSLLTAKHELRDGQCFVTLALNDGCGETLRLDMLCANEKQAKRMEKYFKKNAETVYTKLITMMDDTVEL